MQEFPLILQCVSSWVELCMCVDMNPSTCSAIEHVCFTRFTSADLSVIGPGTAQNAPRVFQALYLVRGAI